MAITAGMVKELREMTGAGMMDCKKALVETEGNMEKAIEFLREKTLCKYIDAFRLLIPVGIMKGAKAKKKRVIVLKNEDLSNIKNPDGYKKIIEFFKTNSGKYTKSELINEHSISQYKLNKLIENEVLSIEEESVFRYNDRVYNKDSAKTLTIEQENIIREYINSDDKMFLFQYYLY